MPSSYDVVVAGLGAVGSAATYYLARHGWHVLGLDRFEPPHTFASSHGGSRIIRRAYFEGAQYLPLLDRAYALWHALEAETDEALLLQTGGLNIGPADNPVVADARRTATAHGIAHEVLTAAEVRRRFLPFHVPDHHMAVWEAGAGLLRPEACIRTYLGAARSQDATLRYDEPVLAWQAEGAGVRITTPRATYHAGQLILCTGGWLRDLLPGLPLHVERQYNGWFQPVAVPNLFQPERCPVYIWAYGNADDVLYGFPDLGRGVKAGLHHAGAAATHPDELDRQPTDADEADLRAHFQRLLPDAAGPLLRSAVCFYTNTPDRDYLIDRHPEHPQVVFASACSGHGFKASNAVGEALAALATGEAPPVDLSAFARRDEAAASGN